MMKVLEFQRLPKCLNILEETLLKMVVDDFLVSCNCYRVTVIVNFTNFVNDTGYQRYLIATDNNSTLVYTGCDNDTTIWPGMPYMVI